MQPLFLTNKISIVELSSDINVHDYQLRDHFLNTNSLFKAKCTCMRQKHYGRPCIIVHQPVCARCKKPTELLVPFQAALFHPDIADKQLTICCKHIHRPPCNRCINCKTMIKCIIDTPYECNISTDVVCPNTQKFNRVISSENVMTHEHVYDIKFPIFYFCKKHIHYHRHKPEVPCVIQTTECCNEAVNVKNYNKCFVITTHQENETSQAKRKTEYIIFDPKIWREQSFNKFMSFIRAVISSPDAIAERYKSFESSNFSISNIKKYKSGKESIIRTAVTGFETQGLYQTATISCIIPYYIVIIPKKLYNLLETMGYDMDYALVKRDPSLLPTCMYVCLVQRNDDDSIETVVTSDPQSKGRHQDQDGDKVAVYLIKKKRNNWDCTKLYSYKIAKMELAATFHKKSTLLGKPRYILSETTLLMLERFKEQLLAEPTNEYFHKTAHLGMKFVNEASAGYLQDEYDEFQRLLVHYNKTIPLSFISLDDMTLQGDKLISIVRSGAKGSKELLDLLLTNIMSTKSLTERKKDMIDLCNKYISSNQDLSRNGRKQFTSLYAAQDLIAFNENIYINKVFYANYSNFASASTFMFNEASLELFLIDLQNAPPTQTAL